MKQLKTHFEHLFIVSHLSHRILLVLSLSLPEVSLIVGHGERISFRRKFPKSANLYIIAKANEGRRIKASTNIIYTNDSDNVVIRNRSVKGDNQTSDLGPVTRKKEKLQQFFLKQNDIVNRKLSILKEVEFWTLTKTGSAS